MPGPIRQTTKEVPPFRMKIGQMMPRVVGHDLTYLNQKKRCTSWANAGQKFHRRPVLIEDLKMKWNQRHQ
jgi:hypothetical protein